MSIALQLVLALILDAVFGEPRWLWSRVPHPAVVMGRLVGALDRALNRPPAALAMGVITVVVLIVVAGGTGWLIAQAGGVVTSIAAAILLAQRSLVEHVRAVADGLRLSLGTGRHAVSMIVSRDVSDAAEPAVARASIESLAENFSDGIVAPAFWFLVGGLPGMAIYKAINTADSMIGYRTDRHEAFGKTAARTDDLLNLIPARISALLIAAASGTWTMWRDIRRDAALHRSPNAGWPEAALAHGLNYALAGPRSYHGHIQDFAWVNASGTRNLGPKEIDAACTLVWKSWSLLLGMGVILCVVSIL